MIKIGESNFFKLGENNLIKFGEIDLIKLGENNLRRSRQNQEVDPVLQEDPVVASLPNMAAEMATWSRRILVKEPNPFMVG